MSRIGLHVKTGPRNGFGEVCIQKPSIVFAVGEGGAIVDAVTKSGGYTRGIYRSTIYNNHPEGLGLNDPDLTKEEAYDIADMFYPLLVEDWEKNPAYAYAVINESGANDITVIKNYVNYEWRMMELAEADGYKICLCNLFSGTPDDGSAAGNPPNGGIEIWKQEYGGLLARGYEGGHIYGRHVYGFPMLVPLDFNSDRPFREIEWLVSQGIMIGVALTECGLHGGEFQPSASVIVDQMDKYDSLMKAYEPFIVGAAWWTYGDWDGAEGYVNLQSVSEEISNYLANNQSERWEPIDYVPPPVKEEPRTIRHEFHLLPQDATEEERMAVVKELAPRNTVFGHSHDALEAMMFHSTREGKIVVWDADRYDYDPQQQFEWLDVNYEERSFSEIMGDDTPVIAIEPLSQRDTRWANDILGQDTGHTKTIGNWGCLLVAYNMLARYYEFTTMLPDEFNDFMVDAGAFSGQYLVNGAFKKAYPDKVIYDGYKSRDNPAMIPLIHDYIDNNWPVPARVDFKPATAAWEQHWVLITGYVDDDFVIADPWTGEVRLLSEAYPITGDDVLEALFYYPSYYPIPVPPPSGDKADLYPYFTDESSYGVLYEVRTEYFIDNGNVYGWVPGPQQRHQTQYDSGVIYHTKGGDGPYKEAEWEQLMFDLQFCYRSIDTSPSDDQSEFYELFDVPGKKWSAWCPRYMAKNQEYQRYPFVQFRKKASCALVSDSRQPSLLKLEDIKQEMTFFTGVTLKNVIVLLWTDMDRNPIERYYYAIGYGLVGWEGRNRRAAISEIHEPGSRPNSVREVVGCLET